jgi:hypothetical protein
MTHITLQGIHEILRNAIGTWSMIAFCDLGTHKLYCECHRKGYEPGRMHQILVNLDLHSMLSMPSKDDSVSNDKLNSERSKLTSYVVDATER